jgi:hypothetical protein
MERGARGRACVPHHGAEALAGDGVPALVVRDCVTLVGGAAMCAAAAHRRRLLPSPCQSSRVLVCGAGGDGEEAAGSGHPPQTGRMPWLATALVGLTQV